VILRERAKQSCIAAIRFHRVDSIHQIADAAAGRRKCLENPKVAVETSALCQASSRIFNACTK
jgi:hypothetical protein